jgi:hypothetical protein
MLDAMGRCHLCLHNRTQHKHSTHDYVPYNMQHQQTQQQEHNTPVLILI